MRKIKSKWICTDPDNKQYGRQLSFTKFEFKERGHQTIINLSDYNEEYIVNVINTYGYSLENINVASWPNIYNLYGKKALWVIAECIFEQES